MTARKKRYVRAVPPSFPRYPKRPISHALWLLRLGGVRTGVDNHLFSHSDRLMSDDDLLTLLNQQACPPYQPFHITLIRELARVEADLSLLKWTHGHLVGLIDENYPSPLQFVRSKRDWSNRQKLKHLGERMAYLVESVESLNRYGQNTAETLAMSRLYRRQARMYLKTNQK